MVTLLTLLAFFALVLATPNSFSCPYNCSGHGLCNLGTGRCTCYDSWSGDYCRWPVQSVNLGTSINGSVSLGQWTYYTLQLTSAVAKLQISVSLIELLTPRVFIQKDSYPTFHNYYVCTIESQVKNTIELFVPDVGSWWIGVTAIPQDSGTASNYRLDIISIEQCPNGCSSQGTCSAGQCSCNEPWVQEDCSLCWHSSLSYPLPIHYHNYHDPTFWYI
eukprot:TRINITY_DN3875_c0_g4_i1.p1 TRINITY_DN3875_c0_g4~~TRINITY_DN3875_c0_g4_i1.p1  ORF type:complete len:218 (+),score=20.77 TRINITY_DN3875_c0_g4_i1:88-741(+)